MKLYELTGVKKYHNYALAELIGLIIKKYGMEKLGAGFFAYVFKHPTRDEVIKFWFKDSGYENYVKYIQAHSSNPMVPKLKSSIKEISSFHTRPRNFPEKIKYIRLEVLTKLPMDLNDLIYDLKAVNMRRIIEKNTTAVSVYNDLMKKPEYKPYVKSISDLLDLIEDLAKHVSWTDFDIKADNMMMRGDQLVLTDPFADDESIEINDELKGYVNRQQVNNLPDYSKKSGPWKKIKV